MVKFQIKAVSPAHFLLQVPVVANPPAASWRLSGGSEDDAGGGCRHRWGAVHTGQPHLHGEKHGKQRHQQFKWTQPQRSAAPLSFVFIQGHIKGYISHQHQKLVVSKQNPFPPLSSVS